MKDEQGRQGYREQRGRKKIFGVVLATDLRLRKDQGQEDLRRLDELK